MKEIGGSRYIDIAALSSTDDFCEQKLSALMKHYGFAGNDHLFLSSGRSAEGFILDSINDKRKVTIVPAFTCETVIQPLFQRNYTIYYYHISPEYIIDCEDLEHKIKSFRPSVVLYHSIYGFSGWQGIIAIIQKYSKEDIVFIEDRTMDWFKDRDMVDGVSYIIGSFRKWFAIPDGGFVFSSNHILKNKPVTYHKELEEKKIEAYSKMYRYRVMHEGSFQECKYDCGLAEECLENESQNYLMAPSSMCLVCTADMRIIGKKRRNNYCFLYEHLNGLKELNILSPKLDDEMIPFHFVVSSVRKKELFEYLNFRNIYPSNVWETLKYFPDIDVNETEKNLYESAFFLEIDQMYGLEDMERIVKSIREFLN